MLIRRVTDILQVESEVVIIVIDLLDILLGLTVEDLFSFGVIPDALNGLPESRFRCRHRDIKVASDLRSLAVIVRSGARHEADLAFLHLRHHLHDRKSESRSAGGSCT